MKNIWNLDVVASWKFERNEGEEKNKNPLPDSLPIKPDEVKNKVH